jgi:hypothetical protein
VITVPQWCTEVAEAFRAAEPALVVPAQLVNDRDAAIAHYVLRALAQGGPEADGLIESIDLIRAGHVVSVTP